MKEIIGASMIELKPIEYNNVWKVCNLSVSQEQDDFVATNSQSLIEAYLAEKNQKVVLPFAIVSEDEVVGFIMFGYGHNGDEDEPEIAHYNYCLWRFMIDQRFQRKGYGRQAMTLALEYLRQGPRGKATHCWLSYEPENIVAKEFYASFGFEENKEMCGDEIVAVVKL